MFQALRSPNICKPFGPDDIPTMVIKMCPSVVALLTPPLPPFLVKLTLWNYAVIFHVPRRSGPFNLNNCRPIYLISDILKAFENVIFDQPCSFRGLLGDRKYGSQPRHPAGELTALVSHSWSAASENHEDTSARSTLPRLSTKFDKIFW